MGHSQYPEVLEATASAQRQSGAEPARCQPTRRAKGVYRLDSLNVGGTEVQAVELATRLHPEGVSAEFDFQRMIEKTDRMYTERLRSRGAE